MYYTKKIPEPFQNKAKKPASLQMETHAPIPIKAKEKNNEILSGNQIPLSPLAALLVLDLFTKEKDG